MFRIGSLILHSLLATGLEAQMGTATLSGTITDPSGSAIPGAQVTLASATEKASRLTDAAGQYVIPAITPGTYELVVKAGGFQPQTITGIALASGQGSTLNVGMKLAEAVLQMTVNEAPPLFETTTATLGSVVSSDQFTQLPMLGRNFTTMVDILPGVNPSQLRITVASTRRLRQGEQICHTAQRSCNPRNNISTDRRSRICRS